MEHEASGKRVIFHVYRRLRVPSSCCATTLNRHRHRDCSESTSDHRDHNLAAGLHSRKLPPDFECDGRNTAILVDTARRNSAAGADVVEYGPDHWFPDRDGNVRTGRPSY